MDQCGDLFRILTSIAKCKPSSECRGAVLYRCRFVSLYLYTKYAFGIRWSIQTTVFVPLVGYKRRYQDR